MQTYSTYLYYMHLSLPLTHSLSLFPPLIHTHPQFPLML